MLRRNGRARCGPRYPAHSGARFGVPLELQGRQMRLLLRGNQRPTKTHVYDALERFADGKANYDRADESLSLSQGSHHRSFVEFSREETDQKIQTAPA